MTRKEVRALFKQIQTDKVPEGLTAERLGEITDDSGQTGLHVCASCGNYPSDITNADLADCWAVVVPGDSPISALQVAADFGHLLPGTTAKELADCVDADGFSALRMAAQAGHLPEDTTAHDLSADVLDSTASGGPRTSSLDVMADNDSNIKDQVPMVLNNTTTSSNAEAKQIAETLRKKNPIDVALWLAREIKRRQ